MLDDANLGNPGILRVRVVVFIPDCPLAIFRDFEAVLRSKVQHTLSTLHGLVLAIGGAWHNDPRQDRLMLSVPCRKRARFAGLWANASAPPVIHGLVTNG